MLKNNSYYKGSDLFNNNYRNLMDSNINPYGYNFESSLRDRVNSDKLAMKTKSHFDRKNNHLFK